MLSTVMACVPACVTAGSGPTRRETRSRKVSQRMAVVDESTRQQVRCPGMLRQLLSNGATPSNASVYCSSAVEDNGIRRKGLCMPEPWSPPNASRCNSKL